MSKYITDYAFRHAAHNPNPVYEHSIESIDWLLDTLLTNIQNDGSYPDDFEVRFDGDRYSEYEAFDFIEPHLERIRTKAIHIFEDYFSEQTDVAQFIKDFDGGYSKAEKAIKFMGIFPVEAVEVRNELAFPELLRKRAAISSNKEVGSIAILRSIMGNAAFLEFQGPHLPPFSTDSLVQFLREDIGQFDQLARQSLSGSIESMDKGLDSGPTVFH